MAAMLVEFLLPGTCTPDRDPPVTKPRVPRWKKEEIHLPPPVTVPIRGRMDRGGGISNRRWRLIYPSVVYCTRLYQTIGMRLG